jgi:hypothetical protein
MRAHKKSPADRRGFEGRVQTESLIEQQNKVKRELLHEPRACAAYLCRLPAVARALHNLLVRLAQAKGRLDLDSIKSAVPLDTTYRAMAIANGVPADDPVLARCRDR